MGAILRLVSLMKAAFPDKELKLNVSGKKYNYLKYRQCSANKVSVELKCLLLPCWMADRKRPSITAKSYKTGAKNNTNSL